MNSNFLSSYFSRFNHIMNLCTGSLFASLNIKLPWHKNLLNFLIWHYKPCLNDSVSFLSSKYFLKPSNVGCRIKLFSGRQISHQKSCLEGASIQHLTQAISADLLWKVTVWNYFPKMFLIQVLILSFKWIFSFWFYNSGDYDPSFSLFSLQPFLHLSVKNNLRMPECLAFKHLSLFKW